MSSSAGADELLSSVDAGAREERRSFLVLDPGRTQGADVTALGVRAGCLRASFLGVKVTTILRLGVAAFVGSASEKVTERCDELSESSCNSRGGGLPTDS